MVTFIFIVVLIVNSLFTYTKLVDLQDKVESLEQMINWLVTGRKDSND